jgi:hypothetical protein
MSDTTSQMISKMMKMTALLAESRAVLMQFRARQIFEKYGRTETQIENLVKRIDCLIH